MKRDHTQVYWDGTIFAFLFLFIYLNVVHMMFEQMIKILMLKSGQKNTLDLHVVSTVNFVFRKIKQKDIHKGMVFATHTWMRHALFCSWL